MGDRTVKVGDDGTFSLLGLDAKRSYRVWAVQEGRGFLQMSACTERREVSAGTRGLELPYVEGITVGLRVVDGESLQPLTQLRVRPRLVGGSGFAGLVAGRLGGPSRFLQYPDGRVTLAHLRPKKRQRLAVQVEALGYAPFERGEIELPQLGKLDLGTVRLIRSPVVRVHVIEAATGEPVVGARVRLALGEKDEEPKGGHSISFNTTMTVSGDQGIEGASFDAGGGKGKNTGKTDAEGRCVLNSFPGRQARISVRSSEHAPYASPLVPLPAASDFEHNASLLAGGAVDVLVVDAKDEPIPQATVGHEGPNGADGRGQTDARGIAHFPRLAPGRHRFELRRVAGGGSSVRHNVRISTGGDARPERGGWTEVEVRDGERASLTLRRPATGSLNGIVRENGIPLPRARVALVPGLGKDETAEEAQMAELASRFEGLLGSGSSTARADGDGHYRLADLPTGEHRLRITHRERAMPALVRVHVREGDGVFDIDLDMTAISGRVLGPDGKGLEGAKVSVAPAAEEARAAEHAIQGLFGAASGMLGSGASPSEAKTDADGVFELRGVRPDTTLVLRAHARGFAPVMSAELRVREGQTQEAGNLELTAAGQIRVRLQGDSPPFVPVQAKFQGGAEDIDPVLGFLRGGRVKLSGLQPGLWKVELSGLGEDADFTQTVEVRAGETAQVLFER
jgi:hypothetical protein